MSSSFLDYGVPDGWRLTVALVLALIVHAAVLMGVHFTGPSEPARESVLTLNITLMEQRGGEPTQAPPVAVEPASALPVSATAAPERAVAEATEPVLVEPVEPAPAVAMTVPDSSQVAPGRPPTTAKVERSEPARPPPPSAPRPPTTSQQASPSPRAVDLMSSGLQMARLETEPRRQASDAREKYIHPKAMTTPERFYLEAWRLKVERVGTLNFPEEARRRNLNGRLTLDVALRADGSVESIRLVRSSGHPVLDEAAQRIVQLAAPYAPFPEELRRQYDVLHIVRTWEFLQGSLLQGR